MEKGLVVSLMADALHAAWGLVRPNEEMRSMPPTSRSVIQLFKHEREQRAARMRADRKTNTLRGDHSSLRKIENPNEAKLFTFACYS
jgi:hypothetical protein